jgi:predicted DNA-binding protein (MmcQ/YjbR family)
MSTSNKPALLEFCRALPGATEDVKWEEHLVFSVGEKMFAMFDVSDAEPFSFKVNPDEFPVLSQQPGISAAPYLARASWVKAEHSRVLPLDALEDLLRESYELVAAKLSKRTRERLGVVLP